MFDRPWRSPGGRRSFDGTVLVQRRPPSVPPPYESALRFDRTVGMTGRKASFGFAREDRRGVDARHLERGAVEMGRLRRSIKRHRNAPEVLRCRHADKAERLLRNLAQRLERDWSGVAGSILEGIDEILTITRLGLPKELRRSLACTNIIENVMSTVRRVCRNVKRWRSASMAMRWTAAAMQEAARGFRRLKAHTRQSPIFRKDSGTALKKVCVRFVELCRKMRRRALPLTAASSRRSIIETVISQRRLSTAIGGAGPQNGASQGEACKTQR